MTEETDGLLAKITQLMQRAPAPSDEGDDHEYNGNGKVPVDRLRREIDRRKAAEKHSTDMGGMIEQLTAEYKAKLAAVKAAAADTVTAQAKRQAEDLGLVELGVTDPAGRAAVRGAWDALPAGERGKSPGAWWGETLTARNAHAGDDTLPGPNIPRTLVGYLPALEGGADTKAGSLPKPGAKRQSTSIDSKLAGVAVDGGMAALLAALK